MKIPLFLCPLLLLAFVSNGQVYKLTSHIRYKTIAMGGKQYAFAITEIDTSSASSFIIDLEKKMFQVAENQNSRLKDEEILSVARNESAHTLTLETKPPKGIGVVWRKYKVKLGNNNVVLAIHRAERLSGGKFSLDTFNVSYTNDAAHLSFYRKTANVKKQASDTREVLTTTEDVKALFNTPFTPADFTFEVRDGIVRWTEGTAPDAKAHVATVGRAWVMNSKSGQGLQYLWQDGDITYSMECGDNNLPVDKDRSASKLVKLSMYKNKKLVSVALMY